VGIISIGRSIYEDKIILQGKNVLSFLLCDIYYHNPSLGLATKARACKVAGQEGSPGVKESVRE
jgi:hypothetical protein